MTTALEKHETRERLPVPVEFFQLSERQDQDQILAEMRGELLGQFVYRMPIRGREIVNLSYAGIREAIRRRGGVEIMEFRVEDVDDEFRAFVKARDHVNQVDVVGASTCKKNLPFAYTIALNKAERNAFRKLIPEKLLALLIDEYQKTHPAPVRTPVTAGNPVPSTENPGPPTSAGQDTNYAKAQETLRARASASDLTADQLSELPWKRSEKKAGLSTILVTSDLLSIPIAKLLHDRLESSASKSWKIGEVTYKLSRNDEGTEWLQKWSSISN